MIYDAYAPVICVKCCSLCKRDKPLDDFHRQARSKDGRAAACKLCKKDTDAASHQRHRSARLAKRKVDRDAHVAWMISLKGECRCTDCRLVHPHWRMQWDHLPEYEKKFEIGEAYRIVAGPNRRQQILDEIEKCELVCANCHCDRTHGRRANVVYSV